MLPVVSAHELSPVAKNISQRLRRDDQIRNIEEIAMRERGGNLIAAAEIFVNKSRKRTQPHGCFVLRSS